ncbi:hypothetical protein AB0F16_37360, partial [Streptomyces tanashiensis]
GEELTVLEQGDFLLVPPHTPHAFAAAPGAEAEDRRSCGAAGDTGRGRAGDGSVGAARSGS